jgi:hypothetical protein
MYRLKWLKIININFWKYFFFFYKFSFKYFITLYLCKFSKMIINKFYIIFTFIPFLVGICIGAAIFLSRLAHQPLLFNILQLILFVFIIKFAFYLPPSRVVQNGWGVEDLQRLHLNTRSFELTFNYLKFLLLLFEHSPRIEQHFA